jgi:predicted restriction endonuclease
MAFRRRPRFHRYRRVSKIGRIRAGAAYKQYLKDRGMLRCEICGWFDPLISPYFLIESHHIKRVADGGSHDFSNQIACCPNHHNLADRISKVHANVALTKIALIALIREHEHNRNSIR